MSYTWRSDLEPTFHIHSNNGDNGDNINNKSSLQMELYFQIINLCLVLCYNANYKIS